MSKSKILITGITGFLGSKLAAKLINQDKFEVQGFSRDAAKAKEKFPYTKIHNNFRDVEIEAPEIIFHAATVYGRKGESDEQIYETNFVFPKALFKTCQNTLKLFINIDSVLSPETNQYSKTKNMFFHFLKENFGQVKILNLKLQQFYGPGSNDIINFVVQQLLRGEKKIDFTSGRQKRDFLFIDDLVDALQLIMSLPIDQQALFKEYEIGSGESLSIYDVVQKTGELLGPHQTMFRFGTIPTRKNELLDLKADIKELKSLGWQCSINLESGIQRVIDHYKTLLS